MSYKGRMIRLHDSETKFQALIHAFTSCTLTAVTLLESGGLIPSPEDTLREGGRRGREGGRRRE